MVFEFEQYTLDVDVQATRKAYEKIPLAKDWCTCHGCENYSAAVGHLPTEVVSFLSSFGVDVARPSEVFGTYDEGVYQYGGFYHVAGKIVTQKEELYFQVSKKQYRMNPKMVIDLADDFSVWFESDCALVPEGFPDPHFQINIDAKLPWLLETPNRDGNIPVRMMNRIKEIQAALLDKKATRTLFGSRYVLTFQLEDKAVRLFASEDNYSRSVIGWSGHITYAGKRLLIMSTDAHENR